MQIKFGDLLESGIEALGLGEAQQALALFERAAKIETTPTLQSNLAYCLARERGQIKTGHSTCEELIQSDPNNLFHHLNLGRILLLEGDRGAAIEAFRSGIDIEPHPQIIRELNLLGVRKSHALPFLSRDNPLNKYFGLLSTRRTTKRLDSKKEHSEGK